MLDPVHIIKHYRYLGLHVITRISFLIIMELTRNMTVMGSTRHLNSPYKTRKSIARLAPTLTAVSSKMSFS